MWRHGCLVAVLTLSITGCAVYERADTTPGESPGVRAVPAHCKAGQPVVLKTQPLSPYVLEGGDGYAYFDVWLQACPAPGAARRQPLDISLVVDTSGSMAGRKIAQARAAAHYLLSVLGPTDRLALVSYASHVTVQFPLTPVTPRNRTWMTSRIAQMYPGGMTNLGGGLHVGTRELTRASSRAAVSRVILISDGLANVGVTHPTALSALATTARLKRASVSTMGVGLQFNELLLQSLAEYGGGRYHYISRAQDLVAIFRAEIQGVQRIVATQVSLQVQACPGCRVESVPGYAIHRRGGSARVAVSDLAGGEVLKALVKVRLPTATARRRQNIGLRLSYRAVGKRPRTLRRRAAVAFRLTADRARVRRTTDARVAGRVARVQANRLAHRAMTQYSFGNSVVAGNLLRAAAQRLRRYTRRYKVKKKKRYDFEAARLMRAARKVARPRAAPGRRHLIKSIRAKASSAYRK